MKRKHRPRTGRIQPTTYTRKLKQNGPPGFSSYAALREAMQETLAIAKAQAEHDPRKLTIERAQWHSGAAWLCVERGLDGNVEVFAIYDRKDGRSMFIDGVDLRDLADDFVERSLLGSDVFDAVVQITGFARLAEIRVSGGAS